MGAPQLHEQYMRSRRSALPFRQVDGARECTMPSSATKWVFSATGHGKKACMGGLAKHQATAQKFPCPAIEAIQAQLWQT